MTLATSWSNLPPTWALRRADSVLKMRKRPIRVDEFSGADVFHYSIPAIQETGDGLVQLGDEIESDKTLLDGGELLVSRLNPRKGCVLVTKPQPVSIVCSTEFVPLVPNGDFSIRFAYYVYLSAPVRELISATVQSVTRSHQRANPEDIQKIWIPVPPLSVQIEIADYLDRETARLDALIAAKERLLVLLAEKRQALITRAVTRGLDPNVPLRDSGIPWLGPIPAHWKVERLKFHLRGLEQGWSPQCENLAAEDGEWGVMKAGCVNGWSFEPTENKRLPDTEKPLATYEIRAGDVLMSRANTPELLGSAALVTDVRSRLLLCDKLYRLDADESALRKDFLVMFLRSRSGRYVFEREATGASNSMQNIGQDTVRNLWIPFPKLGEQGAIVQRVQHETQRLDALNNAAERTIALLKERRSALIAAAVTGQIPIPSEAVA